MARKRSGPSPGATVTLAANVPGVPVYIAHNHFSVTSTCDVLELTSDQGGPVSIDVPDSVYTPTEYATEWQTLLNANGTLTGGVITFSVSYDSTSKKLSFDAGTGHTLALTGVGGTSDAATGCGFKENKDAAQILTSDFEAHGSGTITVDLDENDNGNKVQYAIRNKTTGKYVDTDGSESVSAVWATYTNWNNGGQAGRVTITGLTDFTAYTFDVKAKNEAGTETGFSAESAVMNTHPGIDYGESADNVKLGVPTGNTKVENTPVPSGNYATSIKESFYGDITMPIILQSYKSLTSNSIVVEYSENYDPDTETGDWYDCTEGSGSCGKTGLTASAAGVTNNFIWDSYTDAGESEYDFDVYIRVTPKDSDGDAGAIKYTDAFGVNNRPGKITWKRYQGAETDYPYDKDTTPTLRAVISYIRGGDKGYPCIRFYNAVGGGLQLGLKSIEAIAGWKYESSPGVWVDLTVSGIPSSAVDGTNQMEITVQAGDELPAAEYLITGEMGEVRERG